VRYGRGDDSLVGLGTRRAAALVYGHADSLKSSDVYLDEQYPPPPSVTAAEPSRHAIARAALISRMTIRRRT
jgi:hypothetical protein